MEELFITLEELKEVDGKTAKDYIGRITYNTESKEYMMLGDVLGYKSGALKCIVIFGHGVKEAKFNDFKKGRVSAEHSERATAWLGIVDEARYAKQKETLVEFANNYSGRRGKKKEEKATIASTPETNIELAAQCASLSYKCNEQAAYIRMLEEAIAQDKKKVYKVEWDEKLRGVILYRSELELKRKKSKIASQLI